jgi:hypothetical protein
MANPPNEDLEIFLRRQDVGDLVTVLLELAKDHEAVQARLARMQLADRPDKLAASFKKTLSGWRRSTRFYGYREAGEFGRTLDGWLDQVARELLPKHPPAALSLFEAFIEADAAWFDRADDSDGVIGDTVRAACRHWLQAAARCETPPGAWPERLLKLYEGDPYGAREELLQRADLLLDEPAQRGLVARLESQLSEALDASPRGENPPLDVFRISGALSLLAESLRDPDIMVRASLRYSPNPNPAQREEFARAYLDAGRPADALAWLQDAWGHLDGSRQDLLADALERLGRFEESSPIRQRMFERTLSDFHFQRWLEHLPEAARPEAVAHARQLALRHDDLTAAATLLLRLGDADASEARLLARIRAHRRQSLRKPRSAGQGLARPRVPAWRDRGLPRAVEGHPRSGLRARLRPRGALLGPTWRARGLRHQPVAPSFARGVRGRDPCPSRTQGCVLGVCERNAPRPTRRRGRGRPDPVALQRTARRGLQVRARQR